ncbi:DUF4865 family protein [Actinosynnema sp. CS-041913]
MHAMQYEFTLPADYDMGIIHTRVAADAGIRYRVRHLSRPELDDLLRGR